MTDEYDIIEREMKSLIRQAVEVIKFHIDHWDIEPCPNEFRSSDFISVSHDHGRV